MEDGLDRIVRDYAATLDDEDFTSGLMEVPKFTLITVISDLLSIYMRDRRSPFLRKFTTVSVAGYTYTDTEEGYDGMKYKEGESPEYCYAMPQNVGIDGWGKLNGGGIFRLYTWERFRKDEEENPNILTSGFVEGRLVFIYEFPFRCIRERLREQLKRIFPDGDIPGQYLRSASFAFKHYKDCPDLRCVYVLPPFNLMEYREYLTGVLFEALLKESKKTWR